MIKGERASPLEDAGAKALGTVPGLKHMENVSLFDLPSSVPMMFICLWIDHEHFTLPRIPHLLFTSLPENTVRPTHHHPGAATIISGLSHCSNSPELYTLGSCSLQSLQ